MIFSDFFIFLKVFFDFHFSFCKVSFHNLSIGLSLSSSEFAPSSLATHLHSHSKNTRPHMLDSSKFYLESTFCRFCIFLKYLENEIDSIPSNNPCCFQFLIDIVYLMRFQHIPKNEEMSILKLHFGSNFIEFSSSNIRIVVRNSSFLQMFENHDSSITRDEIFEFSHPVIHILPLTTFSRENIRDKNTKFPSLFCDLFLSMLEFSLGYLSWF